MMTVKTALTGDRVLVARLENLTKEGSRRAMRSALGAGMAVVRKAIRAQIPDAITPGHDNEDFRKAVGSRFQARRGKGLTAAKVGVDVGRAKGWAKVRRSIPKGQRRAAWKTFKAENRPPNPHFHLLSAGTVRRKTKTSANRGRVNPGNYVPRGVAASMASVGMIVEAQLRIKIYDEALKEAR